MRKTDKKIDNQIRAKLTDVCELALKEYSGFQWLTHLVNYSNFPKSLQVICVFDSNESLAKFKAGNSEQILLALIEKNLIQLNINLNNIKKHIRFDTEENCIKSHNGNWAKRLC